MSHPVLKAPDGGCWWHVCFSRCCCLPSSMKWNAFHLIRPLYLSPTSEKRLFLQDWLLELCNRESENGQRNIVSEWLDEKQKAEKDWTRVRTKGRKEAASFEESVGRGDDGGMVGHQNMQKIRFEEERKGGGSKVGFLWIGRVILFSMLFKRWRLEFLLKFICFVKTAILWLWLHRKNHMDL